MARAFQSGAFQSGAFQGGGVAAPPTINSTYFVRPKAIRLRNAPVTVDIMNPVRMRTAPRVIRTMKPVRLRGAPPRIDV